MFISIIIKIAKLYSENTANKLALQRVISILCLIILQTSLVFADVTVDVTLSPAGSFVAKSDNVRGFANRAADGTLTAKNITIETKSLKTGISLRDEHMHKRLLADKHSNIKLIEATGKGGKGEATLEIRGKQQKVKGTYKISGNNLNATFSIKLSDLGIDDVSYMAITVEDEVVVRVSVPIRMDGSEGADTAAPSASKQNKEQPSKLEKTKKKAKPGT